MTIFLELLGVILGVASKFLNNEYVSLAAALEEIALASAQAYQREAGQPLDLSKIPPETPVA